MAWSLPFLIVVVLVLPLLAWNSRRHASSPQLADEALPSLRVIAFQTIIIQVIVFGLAFLACWGADLTVSWRSRMLPTALLTASAVFVLAMIAAWLEARRPLGPRDVLRRKLRRVSASNPTWLAVILVAGITEEYAYRGVLTEMLTAAVGSNAAWLMSAVLFGLAHFTQGLRGFVFSAGFGMAMQGIAFLSGGLTLAIVTHIAYDLGAAWLGRRLEEQQEGNAV